MLMIEHKRAVTVAVKFCTLIISIRLREMDLALPFAAYATQNGDDCTPGPLAENLSSHDQSSVLNITVRTLLGFLH